MKAPDQRPPALLQLGHVDPPQWHSPVPALREEIRHQLAQTRVVHGRPVDAHHVRLGVEIVRCHPGGRIRGSGEPSGQLGRRPDPAGDRVPQVLEGRQLSAKEDDLAAVSRYAFGLKRQNRAILFRERYRVYSIRESGLASSSMSWSQGRMRTRGAVAGGTRLDRFRAGPGVSP